MISVKFISQRDHGSKINVSSNKEPHTHILTLVNLKNAIFAQKPVILTKFKLRSIYCVFKTTMHHKFHAQIKNCMQYFNSC